MSEIIMKPFLKIFYVLLLAANLLGYAGGIARAVSIEEFTTAIGKIKNYEPPQSRETLSEVAGMVRSVGDIPSERKKFAAALDRLLGAETTYACKDFICRQLAIIGGENEVASLSRLLVEEKYSDMARYALERIGGEKTCAAMRAALAKTSGKAQTGIINSLAVLGDKRAVPALAGLADGGDAASASAAIAALGKIGGADAEKVLKKLTLTVNGKSSDEVYDAYLVSADKLVVENKRSRALAIYNNVYAESASPPIRGLALRGRVAVSGADATTVLVKILNGKDAPMQLVAISLAGEIPGAQATTAFAKLLPALSPELQVKMIEMLGYRGDRAARKRTLSEDALKRSTRLDEQKVVLAGLAGVRTHESLKLATVYLVEKSLTNEAAMAVSKIACPQNGQDNGLRGADVMAALKQAALAIGDAGERKKVEDYLATMPEDEDGFVSLFNGKDLTGWAGADFAVEDGILVCHGHHGGGLSYTKSEFTNFVMRFEVKLSPGANNGFNFRTDGAVWNEIQILDDVHPTFTNIHPYQAHGSIYGVVPSKRGFLKPAGEWNYEEVMADGSHIKVRLNGEEILDVELSKLDLDKCLDGTAHPGLRRTSGGIGWLGHLNGYEKEGAVFFRNIRIKTLP